MPRPQAPPVQIARWRAGDWRDDRDQVAAEEPLQLSLDGKPLSIVMRTPGNDLDLAAGFLYYDARVDDARLTLAVARTAVTEGAVAVNYTEVTGLRHELAQLGR